MLRIPHCLDNQLTDGGKVVSPTHPPHVTPQKHYYFHVSGTNFYTYKFSLLNFNGQLTPFNSNTVSFLSVHREGKVWWRCMEYCRGPQASKVCLLQSCSTYDTRNASNTSKPFMRYMEKCLHCWYYTKAWSTIVFKGGGGILIQAATLHIVCSGQLPLFFGSGKFLAVHRFYTKY
jgi:hypothetical protein